MPVRQSFAVEMVGRADVVNAIALNSATFNAARVIGPAVAGLMIAVFDISIAFFINGASFLAVIVALLLMRPDELRTATAHPAPAHRPRRPAPRSGRGSPTPGARPPSSLPVVVVGLAATIGMNFQVTIPPYARDVLGGGAAAFGFLMAASGLGSVAAALYLATRRRPSAWAIAVGATMLGAGLAAGGRLPGLRGGDARPRARRRSGRSGWRRTANTLIQATVPDELRGRVISVYTTVFAGSTPIGALFAGFLASRWGAVAALAVGGVLTVAVGLAALAWLRRHRAVGSGAAEPGQPVVRAPGRP